MSHTACNNVIPFPSREGSARSISPDLSLYDKHLEKFGMTPKEQQEFLVALWTLISGFIDLGYGLHPTQHPHIPNDLHADILRAVDEHSKAAA